MSYSADAVSYGAEPPRSSRDRQVGGDHYSKHKIQPFDIIDEYGLDFYEGNALKYLLRHKGSRVEDLEKCVHYLEKCVEKAKAAEEAAAAQRRKQNPFIGLCDGA